MSIWARSVSTDVSVKRSGAAAPALAQTMSGLRPWFQAVASSMMRVFSAAWVTSALMVWKRCLEGSLAADLKGGCIVRQDRRVVSGGRWTYGYVFDRSSELLLVAGHDDYVRPFLRKQSA